MQFHGWRPALGGLLLLGSGMASITQGAMITWLVDNTHHIGTQATELIGAPVAAASELGPVVVFDGVDDGLLLPGNPIAGWPQFTLEILFRPDAGGGFEQRFLHLGEPNGARALIELRLRPDNQWYLDTFLRSGETQLALIDDTKLHAAGQWFWVALRYDGKRMTHFVNGVMELDRELTIAPLPAGQASLGMRMTRVSWFKGAIREVRFHDSAIAPSALQRGAQ